MERISASQAISSWERALLLSRRSVAPTRIATVYSRALPPLWRYEGKSSPPVREIRCEHVGCHRGAQKRKQGEGSGPARSIPADVRPGEMHASVCFAPLPHGLLRGAGQRAHPVRVLSALPGADRRRVRTGGDGQDSDDEGRTDLGDGSRPFPVDRRMRHRAGVVPQRYHAPDRTGVQIEQHQPAADELGSAHLADSIGRSTGNILVGSQRNFSPTTSDGLISRNFSSITRGHPKNVSRDGVPWICHSLPTGLTLNLSTSSACASARTFLSFDAVLATRASAILATSLYSAASFARMSSAVL